MTKVALSGRPINITYRHFFVVHCRVAYRIFFMGETHISAASRAVWWHAPPESQQR